MRPTTVSHRKGRIHRTRKAVAASLPYKKRKASQFLLRFNVVLNTSLPARMRSTLASHLIRQSGPDHERRIVMRNQYRERHWMSSMSRKALAWIASASASRILDDGETPKIRCALLTLLKAAPLFAKTQRKSLLQILEKIGNNTLALFVRLIRCHDMETPIPCRSLTIIAECLRAELARETNVRDISIIACDDCVMSHIFTSLQAAAAEGAESEGLKTYSIVLSSIVQRTMPAYRSGFINRHHSDLIQSLEIIYYLCLDDCSEHSEFAELIINAPSVMRRVTNDLILWRKGERGERSNIYTTSLIVPKLLQGVIDNAPVREKLLGYGVLDVAAYIAEDNFGDDISSAVATFRAVLTRNPEWRFKYKELTKDGGQTNEAAILGRSLRDRTSRPSKYIWEHDDIEDN